MQLSRSEQSFLRDSKATWLWFVGLKTALDNWGCWLECSGLVFGKAEEGCPPQLDIARLHSRQG